MPPKSHLLRSFHFQNIKIIKNSRRIMNSSYLNQSLNFPRKNPPRTARNLSCLLSKIKSPSQMQYSTAKFPQISPKCTLYQQISLKSGDISPTFQLKSQQSWLQVRIRLQRGLALVSEEEEGGFECWWMVFVDGELVLDVVVRLERRMVRGGFWSLVRAPFGFEEYLY